MNKSIIEAVSAGLLASQMGNRGHFLQPEELRFASAPFHLRYPRIFELRLPSFQLLSHRGDAVVHNRRLIRRIVIFAYLDPISIFISAHNAL